MGRPPPDLAWWRDSYLSYLKTTDAAEWVGAVLAFTPVDSPDAKRRWWTFGEIREAIRKELVHREPSQPESAYQLADKRTSKGVKVLEAQGSLMHRGKRYAIRRRWFYAQNLRKLASTIASGTPMFGSKRPRGSISYRSSWFKFEYQKGTVVFLGVTEDPSGYAVDGGGKCACCGR